MSNFFLDSANHLIREGKLTRSQYMERYITQMKFIEKAISLSIDRILADSRTPPIIILQGDHGCGAFLHHDSLEGTYLQDRLSILNAYYLPGGADGLYDSITPVNTFRVIINRYFDAALPMLEDRSYFATATHPYDYTDVTDRLDDAEDRARFEKLREMDYYPEDIEVDSPSRPSAPWAPVTQPPSSVAPGPAAPPASAPPDVSSLKHMSHEPLSNCPTT